MSFRTILGVRTARQSETPMCNSWVAGHPRGPAVPHESGPSCELIQVMPALLAGVYMGLIWRAALACYRFCMADPPSRTSQPLYRQSIGHDEVGGRSVAVRTQRVDIGDAIGSVLRRAARVVAHHKTDIRLQRDLPMLDLDEVLFGQILFNLLDNAARYAPAGSTVTIRAVRDENTVRLQIIEGPGIPVSDIPHRFEKFYRAGGGDRRRAVDGSLRCDLERVYRGDRWHHQRGTSDRPRRCDFHGEPAHSLRCPRRW
jgi:hypothetical protein